jgi:sugar lactone lactonase YvrE
MNVTKVLATQNELGEGPIWHPDEGALYWLDIKSKQVFRYTPATGQQDTWNFEDGPTAIALRARGGLVLATYSGFAYWNPADGDLRTIAAVETHIPQSRMNDGAVGPGGHFWAGTMTHGEFISGLYRLTPDLAVDVIQTKMGISNGVGWSPDGRTMYVTDSPAYTIYAYDFDPTTSTATNRRVFINDPDEPGLPDGLAVDSAGYLWSARWGGSQVVRYDPGGAVDLRLPVPATYPTSCAFGGEDFRDLYITSAWTDDGAPSKNQGDLYRVRVEVAGQPAYRFKG